MSEIKSEVKFWDNVPVRWSVVYKIDVLDALKAAGYNSTRIRKEKIIGQATVQRLRKGEFVSWDILADLCYLLKCDLSDIIICRTETGEPAKPNTQLDGRFPPRRWDEKERTTKSKTE